MPKQKAPQEYSGYFTLHGRDQSHSNWVLFHQVKPSPKKNPAMPPVFYKFFGNPIAPGGLQLHPRYDGIQCSSCGGMNPYDAFDLGFDKDVKIRMKGDFGVSDDEIFLINRKMLDVLKREKVGGFEVKPVGTEGWYALKVTLIVDANPKVIKSEKKECAACGRPKETFGLYQRLSDVEVPTVKNTFFAPQPMRCKPHWRFDNRDIMVTGEVVTVLKRNGVKGDSCHRLFTEEEWKRKIANEKKGDFKFLPGTIVLLY
jgi:hypothetical protein